MSTKDAVKQLQEYVTVPLAELVESSTNPRKTFDEERLEMLFSGDGPRRHMEPPFFDVIRIFPLADILSDSRQSSTNPDNDRGQYVGLRELAQFHSRIRVAIGS